MPDWVATNAWSILGVLIGLLSIGFAVAIAVLQRTTKRIAFEVVSRTQLVGAIGDIPELDVAFRGQRVTDVVVVQVRVLNVGNAPVASSDYERPIRIGFGPGATVLTAEIERVHPPSLRIDCQAEGDAFVLEPVMLNAGDWVRVKALVSGAGTVSADARIVAVRDIEPRTEGAVGPIRLLVAFGFAAMAIGLYFAGVSQNSALILVAAGAALFVAAAVSNDVPVVRLTRRLLRRSETVLEGTPVAQQNPTAGATFPNPPEAPAIRVAPPPRLREPWAPTLAELDGALDRATETSMDIGPDSVLEFLWIDFFPEHEVNFKGTSVLADRYFQILVPLNGQTELYGVRRLAGQFEHDGPGKEAPWRTLPGWQEIVSLSWLRIVRPFGGSGKLYARTDLDPPRWSAKYETQGAIWETTCYELVEGIPTEVRC